MSYYTHYGAPARKPERTSTGSLVPPGYYQSFAYDDRGTSVTSPRSSNERVVKRPTTLAYEEKYDKDGRLLSRIGGDVYRDPRLPNTNMMSIVPERRSSVTNSAPRPADSRARAPSITTQLREPANTSRPGERYDRPLYYASPSSSIPPNRASHRHSSSIDDTNRSRGASFDHHGRRRESPERTNPRDEPPRGERRGYHLNGVDPRSSRSDDFPRTDNVVREQPRHSIGSGRRERRSSDLESREPPRNLIADTHHPPRSGVRDLGPPPTIRGLGRLTGPGRQSSQRDSQTFPSPSPRDGKPQAYPGYSADDDYAVRRRPRPRSEQFDWPKVPPSSSSDVSGREMSRQNERFRDHELESRGFGLRGPSPESSSRRDADIDRRAILPAGMLPQREPSNLHHDDGWSRESDTRGPEVMPALPDLGPKVRGNSSRVNEPNYDAPHQALALRDREDYDDDDGGPPNDPRSSDKRLSRDATDLPRDQQREQRRARRESDLSGVAASAALAGSAALAARQYIHHRSRNDDGDRLPTGIDAPDARGAAEYEDEGRSLNQPNHNEPLLRQKYVEPKDARLEESSVREHDTEPPAEQEDEDDDYMARLQREMEKATQSRGAKQRSRDAFRADIEDGEVRKVDGAEDDRPLSEYRPPQVDNEQRGDIAERGEENLGTQALAPLNGYEATSANTEFTEEPDTMSEEPARESRVRIVEPPKEKEKPKGILRKPTVAFPDHPPEPLVGVAPHKDAPPVSGAKPNSTYTKIARSYVNPEALEAAGERFTEERDFVVVLRVLSKEQIDKLADKTQKIRDERDRRRHTGGRGDEKGSDEDDRRARSHRDRDRESRHGGRNEESDEDEKRSSRHHHRHRDRDDEDDDLDDEERRRRRRHRRHHRRDDDDDGSDDHESRKSKPKAIEY